jgi:membrane protease YdiL (CAAX protease family)
MPSTWTRLEVAELIVLCCGAALLVVGAVSLTLRKRWADVLRLPELPRNEVEPLDLLVALAAMWVLPGLFRLILAGPSPDDPTTQPTTAPSGTSSTIAVAVFVAQLLTTFILLLITRLRTPRKLLDGVLSLRRPATRLFQASVAYIAVWPLCTGALYLTVFCIHVFQPDYEPIEHNTIKTLLSGDADRLTILLTVAGAVVMAPIVEEIFFRGLFLPLVNKAVPSRWAAVLLSGIAFGLFHHPLYHAMPALAVFGILLGYLYVRTGSLTLVIFLHSIFNGKTLLWLALGATP